VKFSFKGAQKGDDLTVSWVDNKGESDSLVATIQ
jgi:sulfur-oxidizing protein SoxZ